ncbi:hypothetical protein SAMN05660816_02709 [Niastella yeongjuensis]|nr:hypothetical protein SAMN05660816_02709 [Niastella yeongjuensis]
MLLFLLAAALNWFARKEMDYSFADQPGYNQLYEIREQTRITHLADNKNGSITITFAGKAIQKQNDFRVYYKDSLLTTSKAETCTFQPLPDTREYHIKINDAAGDVTVSLNNTPDSVYRLVGNTTAVNFEMTGSNVPIEPNSLYSLADWAMNFDDQSDRDKKEVDDYLRDSIQLTANETTTERILKIADFILQRVKGMDGTPADSVAQLSPVNKLKCVQAGRSKIWCGMYTKILCAFANKAGVPVRFIECGDTRAGMSGGEHVFSEVYLKEYNSWAYVDLTAKTVFVKKGMQYLNTIDVQRLLRYPLNDPDLTADYFNGDSIVQTPYNQVASTARTYFHRNNIFRFYFSDFLKVQNPKNLFERGIKLFYSKPYYAVYGDNTGIGRSQLMVRIISTYIMFFFLGLSIFFGFKWLRQKTA